MAQAKISGKGRIYQPTVTVAGICLWLMAAAHLFTFYTGRDLFILLALTPLVVLVGMFPNTFPLPSKFSQEKISFTLSDAFVLLIASWYGPLPAVFVAGVEGFTSSRRLVRRLSSNLFSSAMMTLAAGSASVALKAVLRYGGDESVSSSKHSFAAVTIALLVASIAQMLVNWGILSTLLAMRHNKPIGEVWKQNLVCAVPLFLPTSAAASLMYLALRFDMLATAVLGVPILAAIYFGHRLYHNGIQERITLMEKSHRETIEALAVAINAKDEVTHEHVLRVQIYAAGVAKLLGCTPQEIEALRAGALLHDIGKIAVPDYILNKPGKLTAAEFDKMKMHTVVGAQILSRVAFPYPIVPVVRHHHERWDGKGYPDGLKGEEIPLTARILSVVDCFDAVREDRQYRKAMTREQAIDFIMSGSGSMYDPRVVGTFITNLPAFEAEILAHRDAPAPTFGIQPLEELSKAALSVAPAAGLAETEEQERAKESQLSREELSSLYELAQTLNGARRTEELLAAFTEKLSKLVSYDTCAVVLASETGQHIVSHAAGEHAALLKGRPINIGEGVTGWVLANRHPFCNADPKLDLTPALAPHFSNYRTLAVFPILKNEELYGVVALYSAKLTEYKAEPQRLIKEAVSLLAPALSNRTAATAPEAAPPVVITPSQTFKNLPLASDSLTLESDLAH